MRQVLFFFLAALSSERGRLAVFGEAARDLVQIVAASVPAETHLLLKQKRFSPLDGAVGDDPCQ